MKETVIHPTLGTFVYEENFWTGKKTLSLNGNDLKKYDKKTFLLCGEEENKFIHLYGSIFVGVSLMIDGKTIQVTPKSTWYEIACSVFIFVLNLVWANNYTLCSIIPIVGGAIGGAICGVMSMMNIIAMKKTDNIPMKLLIWLGMLVGSFVICFILALAILL